MAGAGDLVADELGADELGADELGTASTGSSGLLSGSKFRTGVKAAIGVGAVGGGLYAMGKTAESNVQGDCSTGFGDNSVSDFFSGFAHGFLSIAGLGGVVDPVSNLQSKLSAAQTSLQNTYNANGLLFAKKQVNIDANFITMLSENRSYLAEMMELISTITNENLGRTNITLVAISLLSLIIVLYLLL